MIITIGREYGSGGRLIAKQVSEALNIPFYDKELIKMAAKETGLAEEFITQEEHKTRGFFQNMYVNSDSLPLADQIFIAESEIIRRIADKGSCVIVGRCAGYVLSERTNRISVFIHAPIEDRIKRAKNEYGVENADSKFVIKQDKERASYYTHFTGVQWSDLHSYDLTINSHIGLDVAANIIANLVK